MPVTVEIVFIEAEVKFPSLCSEVLDMIYVWMVFRALNNKTTSDESPERSSEPLIVDEDILQCKLTLQAPSRTRLFSW